MRRLLVLSFLAAALPAAAHHGGCACENSGGQLTLSPDTLQSMKIYLGLHADVVNFEQISNARLDRAAEHGHMLHVADFEETYALDAEFGLLDALSIGASVPYRRLDDFREGMVMDPMEDMGRRASHPAGLGDACLWGKLRVLDGNFRVALMAGVEAPTGKWDARSPGGETLEPHHQPGSGSWDFLGGVAAGYRHEALAVNAALTTKINTMGVRRFECGDSLRLGAGAGYRFLGSGETWSLSGTLDAWLEWSGRNLDHGRRDPDSGGWNASVAPGVRLSVGPAIAQVAFPIQAWNGVREEPDQDFRVVVSAGVSF